MATLVYSTLQTLIAEYVHHSDLTAKIVTFIELAQARMSRDLDLVEMENLGSVATVAGSRYATVPTDMNKLLDIQAPNGSGFITLQQDTLAGIGVRNDAAGSGIPTHYARYGDNFVFAPIPESVLALPVIYTKRIANFSAAGDTDSILTRYPNVYIYAVMIEAMPFVREDKRSKQWVEMYQEEVRSLNEQADDARWSGAPIQINPSLGVTIR